MQRERESSFFQPPSPGASTCGIFSQGSGDPFIGRVTSSPETSAWMAGDIAGFFSAFVEKRSDTAAYGSRAEKRAGVRAGLNGFVTVGFRPSWIADGAAPQQRSELRRRGFKGRTGPSKAVPSRIRIGSWASWAALRGVQ